jgi:hypothetical protein
MVMSRFARLAVWIVTAVALVAALAYLHDPPWLGVVTSGFSTWHEDEAGRRYRWTTRSHASFYVPADVRQVTLPLRLGAARLDGDPVDASLAIDGRVFATVTLGDPVEWVPVTFSLPRRAPGRRAVRVEIIVPRLLRRENLGVQVGEPIVRPGGR